MKALQCELCGSTEMIKDGDFFVCQSCGMKYTLETAKKMMVEGVVQVEGTVKTDRTEDIDRYLTLARTALKASNNTDAEKYASMVLELDLENTEAWLIKEKAIDLGLTLSNDRLPESNQACFKMIELLRKSSMNYESIADALDISIDFIKHLRSITKAEAYLFCRKLAVFPNEESLSLIKSDFVRHLKSREKQWENIAAIYELQNSVMNKFIKEKGDGTKIPKDIHEKLSHISLQLHYSTEYRIAEMRYDAAYAINESVIEGFNSWSNKWKKIQVFDYYGTGDRNYDDEIKAVNTCLTAYDSLTEAIRLAIEFLDSTVQMNFSLEMDNYTRKKLTNELLFKCWKNLCFIELSALDARTYRRYHNQYSSGRVTDDGVYLDDKAKQIRTKRLEEDKKKRDEYDPEKKLEKERKEKIKQLSDQFWQDHPDKATQKKALKEESAQLRDKRLKLKEDRSLLLSPFDFRERREVDSEITEVDNRQEEIESSLSALEDELAAFVSSELES